MQHRLCRRQALRAVARSDRRGFICGEYINIDQFSAVQGRKSAGTILTLLVTSHEYSLLTRFHVESQSNILGGRADTRAADRRQEASDEG